MKNKITIAVCMGLVFIACLVLSTFERSQAANDTSQDAPRFDQKEKLDALAKAIAGQEGKPAEQVFKNIQVFKGVPAGRLLKIMELGWAPALGVDCTHCHVVDQWEKDDKPAKQVARDMAAMTNSINADLLKKIKNLKSPNPIVNCTTCHRGQVKPAISLR